MPTCAALLTLALTALSIVSQTEPASPAQGHDEAAIRSMSIHELLLRMGPDPWLKRGERIMRPEAEELRRRVESGSMSSEDWQVALIEGHVLHTRSRWPGGEPLLLWIRQQPWLQRTRIAVEAMNPPIGTVQADHMFLDGACGLGIDLLLDEQRSLSFAAFPPGTESIDLEVRIDQGDDPDVSRELFRRQTRLWEGKVRLPVLGVASVEDSMPSSSTAEDRKAIKESLRAWCSSYDTSAKPFIYIALGGHGFSPPSLHGLAASLRVELWHGDEPVGTRPLVTSRGWNEIESAGWLTGQCRFEGQSMPLSQADASRWEVRFVGTADGVLPIWEADRWWNGSFTIPLSDLLTRTEDR